MRRSRLLILIALVQSAIALFWMVSAGYIAASMRNPAQYGKSAGDVLSGLKVALLSCGTFALLSVIAAAGMWGGRRWARWVAVFATGFPAAILLAELPDWLRQPDWEDVACAAALSAWTIFLLLPLAGRAFRLRSAIMPRES